MNILVTGFDAFGGEKINPSSEVLKLLPDYIREYSIIKKEINTVAYKSLNQIKNFVDEYKPKFIINIGQAGGRAGITLEKVGINLNEFSIPDNDNNILIDEKIYEDAPDAYFSNLPLKKILINLRNSNIPSSISYSAGTFICNHVLFGVMHLIKTNNYDIKAGFVHIPYIPSQVVNKNDIASMNLIDIKKAVEVLIDTLISDEENKIVEKFSEGKIF